MGKKKKGKSKKRGGYYKKRSGGHKSKKVPIAATLGALAGAYNAIFLVNSSGASVSKGVTNAMKAPTSANIQNAVRIMKGTDVVAVATPVVLGFIVSGAGKWLGANKFVHRIPIIGKKVNI